MKKQIIFICMIAMMMLINLSLSAQVLIDTVNSVPASSAMLDVKSTVKGVLVPRMNTNQMNAISSPTDGLLVYNTTVKSLYWYNGLTWKQFTTVREAADEFTATTSRTGFTLTQDPSANSKVIMYINGVRISNIAYSNTGTALTYIPANNGSYALVSGDRIQIDYYY
jgi:hypothetical protein